MKSGAIGVYVVSYGRAGHVTTDRYFEGARVVCPAAQAAAYATGGRMENDATIWPCPDAVDGNVSRKRNWILDNAPEPNVLLLDDDYKAMLYIEGNWYLRMSPPHVSAMVWDGFAMARDLGVAMWGVNQSHDRRFYREYSPLSFLTPILGPFQAFCRDLMGDLRYDESLWLKEDYDLSLRVLRRDHRTLRFNKYMYVVDHLQRPGGVVGQRTAAEEARQFEVLRQRWGAHIIHAPANRSHNPRVIVPLRGI